VRFLFANWTGGWLVEPGGIQYGRASKVMAGIFSALKQEKEIEDDEM